MKVTLAECWAWTRGTKDTEYARLDLVDMNIRLELHLRSRSNGRGYEKPPASYTLAPKERDGFYEYLKSIKYPDGYAANLSRCVTSKNRKLVGMKSHNCHVCNVFFRLACVGMRTTTYAQHYLSWVASSRTFARRR